MALVPGTRLGPYEILAPLGAGGMGEVYRARDTRLGRSVAVKIVKASGTGDPALRERFEREARAISALDHPHICPLYDVGQDAGVEFLVMPCLEGDTLASRLHQGALPLDTAIAIATQIADALDRAHRAGFVHRDLKPANIMLTKGSGARHGEVHATLLDFGLAKLTASPVALNPSLAATQPPAQENLTGDATLVGTLLYMAPEQIEGKPVDARADLFALGAILHEMITGRPAFAAASPASVIAAILAHDPPPLSAVSTKVSAALDATVQRCLAKSPDDRFQSASDLRFALQTLRHEHSHGAAIGSHRSRRNLPVRAVLTVVGAMTLAGIGWMVTRPLSSVGATVPRLLNSLQVTSAGGVEDDAAWSADGRTLAYAADPNGGVLESNWDIWVVQPGGTQSLNRTPDSAADDRFPSWSPDGTRLAFWSNRDGGGCYVMPALAGSPRRIAEASRIDPNPPAWSADGSQIACVTRQGEDVYASIHTLRDGSSRKVALPGPVGGRFFLTWSPDQKLMAYIETSSGLSSDATQLWVLRLDDGKAFPITEGRSRTRSPSWSPQSDAIYFVSNLDGGMDLWRQALASGGGSVGPPVRVTTGIGMRSASLSSDGSKVVYSQGRSIANLWRAPIPANGRATWADVQQITFDQAYIEFVSVAPNGKQLMVTSDRIGNPDLWQLSVDGGELQPVVADPAPDWDAAWSPDGRQIAFFSYRSGNRDLWRVAVNGGPAEQLTDDPGSDLLPTWSPDGKTIAFESRRAGTVGIWLLPTAGGQALQVPTSVPMWFPRWSPDGRWLAVLSVAGELWRISPTGADPEVRLVDQV